jgi:hypothetical protein
MHVTNCSMCFSTSDLISHQLYEMGTKQGSSKDMWHKYVCMFIVNAALVKENSSVLGPKLVHDPQMKDAHTTFLHITSILTSLYNDDLCRLHKILLTPSGIFA